jgi:hypothetical protein
MGYTLDATNLGDPATTPIQFADLSADLKTSSQRAYVVMSPSSEASRMSCAWAARRGWNRRYACRVSNSVYQVS